MTNVLKLDQIWWFQHNGKKYQIFVPLVCILFHFLPPPNFLWPPHFPPPPQKKKKKLDACATIGKMVVSSRIFLQHGHFCMGKSKSMYIFKQGGSRTTSLACFAITYFCNHCNIRFENTSKYVDTLTLFSKNLNQRSLTPRWPLTPCLLRSHVWLYPRIIVSKSHGNTSMYVDTVINFANYHIHTHTTY